jgi:ferredoxin
VRGSAPKTGAPTLDDLRRDVQTSGLAWRGAFHPRAGDDVPSLADGAAAGTLVLLGFAGRGQWPAFVASVEHADGHPHPLDRWSRRVIGALGARHGAMDLYPSDGPPWLPFQRWAMQAEAVHRSPLGILIHPDWGLWHAYRGALVLRERIDLPAPDLRPSPCASCVARPCENACPVSAISRAGYDTAACGAHVAAEAGADCLQQGCRARRACPVGAAQRYGPEQAEFHMRAFLSRR